MASGSANKLNIALQQIIDDMRETKHSEADIEAIEEENAQLRQKKMHLMAKLNQRLTANKSILYVKDMLSQLKAFNQSRSELRELVAMRSKERLREISELTALTKDKTQEMDHLMELPYNEVQEKLEDMEREIIAGNRKINELNRQRAELSHEETENGLNLKVMKTIEEEQKKLIEELTKDTDMEEVNKLRNEQK